MSKKARYRGRTIQEILEMDVDDPMSVSNVNKYLDRASSLFNYALKRDFVVKNHAGGLQIKQDKREDEWRDRFTDDDLQKLFCSEAYLKDDHLHSYYFWLPILGLYTGCRLNELCQLRLDDIKEVGGVWVIDVNEQGEGKKLKNKPSRRNVPLHPCLTDDLKFVQYVNSLKSQGEERLFPELPLLRDGYAQTASKWFARYRQACGVADPRKVYHSFRHTFMDVLKQNPSVDNTMLMEVAGHEVGSITLGRYGKRYAPKVLLEHVILKLDFGVDLSHLKKSRFVVSPAM
jgi:integrase